MVARRVARRVAQLVANRVAQMVANRKKSCNFCNEEGGKKGGEQDGSRKNCFSTCDGFTDC